MRWLVRGERDLPVGLSWLTTREREYTGSLRFTKRRTEFLLRRLVAKHAVAAVTGWPVDPAGLARIEVANAPSGAPYLLLDEKPTALELSISDRAGWAVCLVGDHTLGCDLELVEPRSAGFVRDFLTVPEREYVAAQPDGDARHAAANLLWSAKESVLKVLRTGLRRDTRDVTVTIHSGPDRDGWAPLSAEAAEGVFAGWWRRDGHYLCTLAGLTPAPPPVALEDPRVLAAAQPVDSWRERPLWS